MDKITYRAYIGIFTGNRPQITYLLPASDIPGTRILHALPGHFDSLDEAHRLACELNRHDFTPEAALRYLQQNGGQRCQP